MREFGLIGYPLGHSFSRGFFTQKFEKEGLIDCRYLNFPLESVTLAEELVREHPSLEGFNITIPYKQAIFPYLTSLDPEAREIGAVNCVKIRRNSEGVAELTGYNTDAFGFRRSLLQMIGDRRPAALVLGTGGASKAVGYVLKELDIDFVNVSRRSSEGTIRYEELTPRIVSERKLIVNCTPLGTFPQVEAKPDLPYDAIGQEHFLKDLVYNPAETAFLREGRLRGATVKNGYSMLVGQAERSWEIWNDKNS